MTKKIASGSLVISTLCFVWTMEGNSTHTCEVEALPLPVYPNPTTDYIHIQIPQGLALEHTWLQVTDLTGSILYKNYLYTAIQPCKKCGSWIDWPFSRVAGKSDLTPAIKGSGGLFSISTHSWPVGSYQITLYSGSDIYGSQVVKTN
ncbi:MAG: hypothetical protein IPL46_25175 [Saprospiraceae bacterium]|nr:hypothetical protein [Saprospiraceae bacterium]